MTLRGIALSLAMAAGSVWASTVTVDFADERGPVKPVNGVGQPPILGLDGTNMFHYLREAGIPCSRLHDVGGLFGKNVFVDIPNLFRDFDADETDPENYDFYYTDILMKGLVGNGIEPYFRLGVSIENAAGHGGKAYRIFPPRDYAKWARICEHVIRHYTEGWAGGFRMKISHWEIWNEPDSFETIEKSMMWKAPFSEYVRLYLTAAPYLKAKFPHLKIGGYASCGFYAISSSWAKPDEDPRQPHLMKCFTDFLSAVRDAKAPLDFFSFHCYDRPEHAERQIAYCRKTLDEHGFRATEMSLNEWLPCSGGADVAELDTSLQAAQVAAMLALMQNGPVDDAEIYDARATGGSYAPFFAPETHRPRKAYRVYCAFNELRKLGTSVAPPSLPKGLWACGATDGKDRSALLVANASDEEVALDFCAPGWDMVSFRDVLCETDAVAHVPSRIPPNGVWLIRFGRIRKRAKVFDIADFGARTSDALMTREIQSAIDACWKAGGGEVRVPAGIYRTGGLRLRSKVTLHLMSGAVLEGSRNPDDYAGWLDDSLEPVSEHENMAKTRSARPCSRWNNAIVRAFGAHDIAIVGEAHSQIDGRNCFDPQGEEGYRGPHAINMWHCTNVVLRGYSIRDSGNWAHAIQNSACVRAEKLAVFGGHDGFDVRTCDDVTIVGCTFRTGDDAIAGFDNLGVRVRDCILDSACNAMRFGGTDVVVENCRGISPASFGHRYRMDLEAKRLGINDGNLTSHDMGPAFNYYCDFRAKIRRTPGDITIRNCVFENPWRIFNLAFDGQHKWCCNRSLSSIVFEDCTFTGVRESPLYIHGDAKEPLSIVMRRCKITAAAGSGGEPIARACNFKTIELEDTELKGYSDPRIVKLSEGGIVVRGGTSVREIKESVDILSID